MENKKVISNKVDTPQRLKEKANRHNLNRKPSKIAKNKNVANKPLWKIEKEVGVLDGESFGWCVD